MAQRLVPGFGYVDDDFTGPRLVPGLGYVEGSATEGGVQSASLAWIEQGDVHAISAEQEVNAALAWTEGNDVHAIAATVAADPGAPLTASLGWTEADDITDLTAAQEVLAQFGWTEQGDSGDVTVRLPSNGAPSYELPKRKRYIVRKNGQLLVFSDPAMARAMLDDEDQADATVTPPESPQKPQEAPQAPITPMPVETIDLSEIRSAMTANRQQAEYQRLLAKQQYETLLLLLERIREDEEDEWLLMQS